MKDLRDLKDLTIHDVQPGQGSLKVSIRLKNYFEYGRQAHTPLTNTSYVLVAGELQTKVELARRAAGGGPLALPTGTPIHHRVDARQSQKSIPRIYRGIDVKSRFLLPLT